MVKHILMWNVKEGLDKDQVAATIREKAAELLSGIDGVLKLEILRGYRSNSRDLALYSEMADRNAVEHYLAHPDHETFKAEYSSKLLCDLVIIDSDDF